MIPCKRILILGRSEPIEPEPEVLVAYDHRPCMAKWTAIWLSCVFFMCLASQVLANCQDPNTLSPQLKKAYDQLKKVSNGDFGVSIRCQN